MTNTNFAPITGTTPTPAQEADVESTDVVFTVTINGRCHPKKRVEAVRRQVESRLHTLEPGKKYKAPTLYGHDSWEAMENGDKRKTGEIIAFLVGIQELPLIKVEMKHEYPYWYQLA